MMISGSNICRQILEVSDFEAQRVSSSKPVPAIVEMEKIVRQIKAVLFPHYFLTQSFQTNDQLQVLLMSQLDEISSNLFSLFHKAFLHTDTTDGQLVTENRLIELSACLLAALPKIKRLLVTDIEAAVKDDPSARHQLEVALCHQQV